MGDAKPAGLRDRLRALLLRSPFLYRLWVRRHFHGQWRPSRPPSAWAPCAVLRRKEEAERAAAEVGEIGLPRFGLELKFWDALSAVRTVLASAGPDEEVLDAGAEFYSPILHWLSAYGYRRLRGCNLTFGAPERKGRIVYERGDITALGYGEGRFAAVTCMSVVEHGVDLGRFFAEMARVLRPGGALVVSTDYWDPPLDTGGRMEFGVPVRVFARGDILAMADLAARSGFRLAAPLDTEPGEALVRWNGLEYTFLIATFRKC